jgi:NAD-dependent dihydropyrimidine dehydrogenase PreA subunit
MLINTIDAVFPQKYVIGYLITTFILSLIITFDLMGMTPIYKSDLHQETYEIFMDIDKCKIAGFCEIVCPRNCFEVDKDTNVARIAEPELCVKCGACIVNCPFDALYFKYSDGDIIQPQTIRKYKLNLLGERKQLTH